MAQGVTVSALFVCPRSGSYDQWELAFLGLVFLALGYLIGAYEAALCLQQEVPLQSSGWCVFEHGPGSTVTPTQCWLVLPQALHGERCLVQRFWVGRSLGCFVSFQVEGGELGLMPFL